MQSTVVYAQNMAVAAFTSLISDVTIKNLGNITFRNVRHLRKQSTEPQVLEYLRELRKSLIQ